MDNQKYEQRMSTRRKNTGKIDNIDECDAQSKRIYDTLHVLFRNICGSKEDISPENFGRFCAWFRFGEPIDEFFENLLLFFKECWPFFFGICTNPEFDVGTEERCFLVRFSDTERGAFVLCFRSAMGSGITTADTLGEIINLSVTNGALKPVNRHSPWYSIYSQNDQIN
eukprot:TRINITY_DN2239_c0_g1_i2.p1 TRINITY_DN2239_c0_g1~~TRINITY_DN2239_c0_g1_i2.p1  ORF type:complete len:169 (+),score=22.35 TRINITY_DN2239_c0_g1_i2:449-955(+)